MKRQNGFVSIIVALFIMIFVSLLALGFAFLARQNQYQNQNRALSTQAFYAAESGVNDAVHYLNNQIAAGTPPPSKTTCNPPIVGVPTTIGSNNPDIKYTCLLFNTNPNSLEYTVTGNSTVARVQSQNGSPIQSITISWEDTQNSSTSATFASNNVHALPQTTYTPGNANNLNNSTGILRATLIPLAPGSGGGTGSFTRDDLTDKSQTLFLYPKGNGTPNVVGTTGFLSTSSPSGIDDANQGTFVDGNCNTGSKPKFCNVTINNLTSLGNTSTFFIRMRTMYRPGSSVTITANTASSGASPTTLSNGQAVVDSTGKADNVLRRIQVRVPLIPAVNAPEYAVETVDSQCKRLEVWQGGSLIDNPGTFSTPTFTLPNACGTQLP